MGAVDGTIMGLVATVVLVILNAITLSPIGSEALLPLPTSIVFVVAYYLVRQRCKRHLVKGLRRGARGRGRVGAGLEQGLGVGRTLEWEGGLDRGPGMRPSASSRKTSSSSRREPSLEPMIEIWRANTSIRSISARAPDEAPHSTIRPLGASAAIAPGNAAWPRGPPPGSDSRGRRSADAPRQPSRRGCSRPRAPLRPRAHADACPRSKRSQSPSLRQIAPGRRCPADARPGGGHQHRLTRPQPSSGNNMW